MSESLTRRGFLQRSGMTAAGAAGLSTLFQPAVSRAAGANERVRLGLIGCGPRGTANLLLMIDAGAECVALADPDDRQAGATADKVVARGQSRRPVTYRHYRKLLEHNDVDAVLVSTPDHWHAICTIHACMAGKHVFVEKPISHNIREGQAMVRAARQYDRLVQVGTQQRSCKHFIEAKQHFANQTLGKICLVKAWVTCHDEDLIVPETEKVPPHVDYDLWLGPAPERPFNRNRFHYQWRWFWDYAGGKAADWGIHLIDIVHWYMDVDAPTSAASTGGTRILQDNRETPDTQAIIFEYPGFTCTWEHRQGNARGIEDKSHGIAFYGENGTLVITRGGYEMYSEGQRMSSPAKVKGEDELKMFVYHAEQFLRCVKTREKPNADIEIGHRSTSACQLGNIAFRAGRQIRWDPQREQILDDPKAAEYLGRTYRKPFTLPEV